MITRRQLFATTAAVSALGLPGSSFSEDIQPADNLWKSTLSELLTQELWTNRDGYDATHHLMIPMHAAFASGDADRQGQFQTFFAALVEAWQQGKFDIENIQNRAQFIALPARYLRLVYGQRTLTETEHNLTRLIMAEHEVMFAATPYPHWSHDEFPSVKAMVEWKLTNPETPREFEIGLFDLERFLFAIAADLHVLGDEVEPGDSVITARQLGLRMLRERGVFTEDGCWLPSLNPTWDHPDSAYAGHSAPFDGMEPQPVPGLAEDTSHAHRWPYVLGSFRDPHDPELTQEVNAMIAGLAKQFVEYVLVPPSDEFPGYRTTNYMDGHNGIYRWQYPTQGEGSGYLPYDLSGTFLLGWWSLLGSDAIRDAYQGTSDNFPLTQEEIDLYVGPNTTRERNPLFTLPGALTTGIYEVCAQGAVVVAEYERNHERH